jgi:hypothetical protein
MAFPSASESQILLLPMDCVNPESVAMTRFSMSPVYLGYFKDEWKGQMTIQSVCERCPTRNYFGQNIH